MYFTGRYSSSAFYMMVGLSIFFLLWVEHASMSGTDLTDAGSLVIKDTLVGFVCCLSSLLSVEWAGVQGILHLVLLSVGALSWGFDTNSSGCSDACQHLWICWLGSVALMYGGLVDIVWHICFWCQLLQSSCDWIYERFIYVYIHMDQVHVHHTCRWWANFADQCCVYLLWTRWCNPGVAGCVDL